MDELFGNQNDESEDETESENDDIVRQSLNRDQLRSQLVLRFEVSFQIAFTLQLNSAVLEVAGLVELLHELYKNRRSHWRTVDLNIA